MLSLNFGVGFVLLAIVVGTSAKKTCKPENTQYLTKCVTEYAMGFGDSKYGKWDDLRLHCYLDSKLAKCVNKYIMKANSPTFNSLARASASYVVFEEKIKVCRLYKAKDLLKKLEKVRDSRKSKRCWKRSINRLLHPGKIPKCVKEIDTNCVKQYAQRMRKDGNLCVNIPFKAECLRRGYQTSCKAGIVHDILGVFPQEANKVLAKLCQQQQDIGA